MKKKIVKALLHFFEHIEKSGESWRGGVDDYRTDCVNVGSIPASILEELEEALHLLEARR